MRNNIANNKHVRAFIVSILLLVPAGLIAQGVPDEHTMDQKAHTLVSGTQVSITLPDVFVYNAESGTYIYSGAAASIVVKELPGTAFNALTAVTSAKTFENQGMEVKETVSVITAKGMPGILYKTVLSAVSSGDQKNVEFERLIFFTGNENKTVWVTVSYPKLTAGLLADVMNECLLTIEF